MKAEDAKFESIMEGNDPILPINLQESLPPLANTEKQNTEKITPSSQLKSAGRSSRTQISQRRIYGNMSGIYQRGTIQESNETGGLLDSDSDLLIDRDLNDDDDNDIL